MATDKPRFTITLDEDTLEQVIDYKDQNKLSTQSKAIQKLIKMGIERTNEKKTPGGILPPEIIPVPNMRKIPLVGTIACGTPILAEENIEEIVDMPEHVHADFCLRCRGDSMINARIYDRDIVYIRKQPTVDDGQIAAVLIGDEATLKRVHFFPDHIVLEPENPLYRPLVYWEQDMEQVHIIGLAVAFTSNVR